MVDKWSFRERTCLLVFFSVLEKVKAVVCLLLDLYRHFFFFKYIYIDTKIGYFEQKEKLKTHENLKAFLSWILRVFLNVLSTHYTVP